MISHAVSTPALPDAIRVVVRGWLNSNQVVMRHDSGHVVVDSGYHSRADETLECLRAPYLLGDEGLARLVNTHCHADHMGANAALVARYGCRIAIPRGEASDVDEWSGQAWWNQYVDQHAPRFRYDDTLAPGDVFEAGGLDWQAHPAPGHDMQALVFFNERHRILVSGDALWENGLGFVWPHEGDNPFVAAALETLERIEGLHPRIVIPGHGAPFEDVAGALARARSRLAALGADSRRAARHMLKVIFVFALLDRGAMRPVELEPYLRRVPCYGDINRRFLGEDLGTLGRRMVDELASVGALCLDAGQIRPTMPA